MTKKKTPAKGPAPKKAPKAGKQDDLLSPDANAVHDEMAMQAEREAAYLEAQAQRAQNPEPLLKATLPPGTALPKGVRFETDVEDYSATESSGAGPRVDPRAAATEEQIGDIVVECGEALAGAANSDKVRIIWRATRFALGECAKNSPDPLRNIEEAVTALAHATVPLGNNFVVMARRWLAKAKLVEFQSQVLNAYPDFQE